MLEGSNVDITAELVALISAQRNFQANSKALDTQNKITDTIYNIQS
jgi:flagellar hook protein FlgE